MEVIVELIEVRQVLLYLYFVVIAALILDLVKDNIHLKRKICFIMSLAKSDNFLHGNCRTDERLSVRLSRQAYNRVFNSFMRLRR